jgi:hypothetical protein
MWLTLAKTAAQGPKDEWVRDLYGKDWGAASDDDRQVATAYLSARGKDARGTEVAADAKPRGFIAGFVELPGMLRPLNAAPPPNFGSADGEPPPQ